MNDPREANKINVKNKGTWARKIPIPHTHLLVIVNAIIIRIKGESKVEIVVLMCWWHFNFQNGLESAFEVLIWAR